MLLGMKMYLKSIHIKNYRSCSDCLVNLEKFSALVGYNNAGKTNILNAINTFLEKKNFSKSDYNNPENPIEIIAKLGELTSEALAVISNDGQRNSLLPYIIENELLIKVIQDPFSGTKTSSKFLVRPIDDSLDWSNPNGIDGAIKALLPEPIVIYSMQDANEDVGKLKATNTLGKLIKRLSAQIINPEVTSKINDLNKLVKGEDSSSQRALLNEFEDSVSRKMDDFFPDIKIELKIEDFLLEDILAKSRLQINENGSIREFSNLGHGAQRSIQMSLIRQLADYSKRTSLSSQVILIDEPELYLHPQAIELLRESLEVLSKNGFQIIFTTHTPFMIKKEHILGTNIIRKISNETIALPRICETIASDTSGSMNILFGIENIGQLLFSDHVLLVEGTTEQLILPSLCERILNSKLQKRKIAIIHAGGSGAIATMINILKKMNLSYKAVVDLDFAFKVASQRTYGFLSDDHMSFLPCKEIFLRLQQAEKIYLGDDGFPRNGKTKNGENNISAAKGFELLAEQEEASEYIKKIHQDLRNHNIWVWRTGAIESCLCLEHKESGEWHNYRNNLISTSNVENLFNYPNEIFEFISWLSGIPIYKYIGESTNHQLLKVAA